MMNLPPLFLRLSNLFIAVALLVLMQVQCAASTMPVGMKGWWYFTGVNSPDHYASDPLTACTLTAENHMRAPLLAMRPTPGSLGNMMDCKYQTMLGVPKEGDWYGIVVLYCDSGYTPRWPGVCLKHDEAPAPLCCSLEGSGYALGNPVQLASGSKVQSEVDLVAGPGNFLQIGRTYRSFRRNWKAQSAGTAWSFSFDRDFTTIGGGGGTAPTVAGVFGDGSSYTFEPRSGQFVSLYDKRLTLKALNSAYDDWVLTNIDGQVERYKKINGVFRMISAHRPDGESAVFSYDGESQLVLISDANGRSVKIVWHEGLVDSIEGPSGMVRYEYQKATVPGQVDVAGTARLEAVHFHDDEGALLASRRYHYEHEGRRYLLTGITDENNVRFATYAYNDAGQALLSEHAGGVSRYAFAYPTDLTRRVTDPLGTERTFGISYPSDSRGRITSESQPAGAGSGPASESFTYGSSGDLASRTDFNGHKTCFVTDAARGLETRRIEGLSAADTCPVPGSAIPTKMRMTSTQWHPDMPIRTVVAEANVITTFLYNGERGADGQIANCASDAVLPNGRPIAALCSKTIQPTTDSNGTLGFAASKAGAPRVWQYTYNGAGQQLTRTGPAGANSNVESLRQTYYTETTDSHAIGDLESATNGAGEVTQYREYSRDGLATNIKRANGQTIRLEFGPRRRLMTRTVEDSTGASETTRYQYDDVGQLTRITAPDGSAVEYSYDAAHRLTDLRDGAGNTVHFNLDNMGNVIRQEVRGVSGELVTITQRTFDALNRLQKEQRDDQDAGTTFAYDRGNNLTTVTDPLGRLTTQVFDNFDRVLSQTLPSPAPGITASTIGYSYSAQDQLLSVTDPRKLTSRYIVDAFGQQTSVISPDTGTTTTQFDGAGNPDYKIDATGRKTVYRFDAGGRVIQIGTNRFEYGADGSGATGRLITMIDKSGQTSYSYDGFGRVLAKKQSVTTESGTNDLELVYTYGRTGASVGHVTSMTYPSGNRVDISYASDGRAISLAVTAPGASTAIILEDIRYSPFGRVRGWNWGNSTAASPNVYERQFDEKGRIVSYPLGHPSDNGTVRKLSYDPAGRIVTSQHTGGDAAAFLDQRYYYDGLDRLTGFDGAYTSQRFQYDTNGNRTQTTYGANTYLHMIDAVSNRLISTTGPGPSRQNSYDSSGNLTSDGPNQFGYGNDGRMSGILAAGIQSTYRYNGLGQRVAKTGPAGSTVYYLYDENGRLLGEYDGANKAKQETVYLGDLPVAVLQLNSNGDVTQSIPGLIYYIYADHIQTPRILTRASDNKMVWRWDSADPFGLNQPDENPNRFGVFQFNLRFPGQIYDKETNLHYNYFRDYDPQTGRYIQSDPIGLAGGSASTYSYVNGDPLNLTDFFGLAVDVKKMTNWLDANAYASSHGQCANHVRRALEAGGGDSGYPYSNPRSAKDWGPTLETNDFEKIPQTEYSPKQGDTVVFGPLKNHPDGHIETYNGEKWVSDYSQNNFIPPAYKGAPYTIYRPR